ncbi:hypothetical protein ACFLTP_09015 [Chloroflexota bacterium]
MWKPEKVERALFMWEKWRQSIISQWLELEESLEGLTLTRLMSKVRKELRKIGMPVNSIWLQIYWICCVVSEYNFSNWNTFNNITAPAWLLSKYDPIMGFSTWYQREPIHRVHPPEIWDEAYVIQLTRRVTGLLDIGESDRIYPWPKWGSMFVPSHHKLYKVLNKIKGRPRTRAPKAGRHPFYSDYLAIKCAVLKDKFGMTYVEIATKFRLPITTPFFSRQSDLARHLVARGRKLLIAAKIDNKL